MSFKRWLTSVLCSFILLSSFLILPVSAADDDNYYSLSPVSADEPSTANLYPVNPAEFTNSDSTTLTNIYKYIQYLTLSPASWQRNSIVGFLERIFDAIPSNLNTNFALQGGSGTNSLLNDISKWTMFSYNYLSSDNIAGNLGNISRNTLNTTDAVLKGNSILSSIDDGVSILATENTLSDFSTAFKKGFTGKGYSSGTWSDAWPYEVYFTAPDLIDYRYYGSFGDMFARSFQNMFFDTNSYFELTSADGKIKSYFNGPTIYRMIKLLQETLASEDDRKLAENYKDNRQQAEKDFLNGSSGKTSLGKDDFVSLSSVGGTFKDITSLNGQSSITDFTSGLSDADTTGQGWFSQSTKDALDSVSDSTSSTSSVSTFSDDGLSSVDVDPDPYNMGNFEDNYSWLWGEK